MLSSSKTMNPIEAGSVHVSLLFVPVTPSRAPGPHWMTLGVQSRHFPENVDKSTISPSLASGSDSTLLFLQIL